MRAFPSILRATVTAALATLVACGYSPRFQTRETVTLLAEQEALVPAPIAPVSALQTPPGTMAFDLGGTASSGTTPEGDRYHGASGDVWARIVPGGSISIGLPRGVQLGFGFQVASGAVTSATASDVTGTELGSARVLIPGGQLRWRYDGWSRGGLGLYAESDITLGRYHQNVARWETTAITDTETGVKLDREVVRTETAHDGDYALTTMRVGVIGDVRVTRNVVLIGGIGYSTPPTAWGAGTFTAVCQGDCDPHPASYPVTTTLAAQPFGGFAIQSEYVHVGALVHGNVPLDDQLVPAVGFTLRMHVLLPALWEEPTTVRTAESGNRDPHFPTSPQ